jgi:acyl carrier protein
VITKSDIRTILAGTSALGLPAEIDDDTPLVIDSFTLTWLRHEFEQRFGLVIQPQHEDLATFDSVNAIHAYVAREHPEAVGAVEEPASDR